MTGRLLFACEGRDAGTVKTFAEDIRDHGGDPDAVTAACIDMSRAYIAGVGRHLPNAAVTFDRFHVVQLANAALEEVRRAEVRGRARPQAQPVDVAQGQAQLDQTADGATP